MLHATVFGQNRMVAALAPTIVTLPEQEAPQYVLPEDRARIALRLVCTMRDAGYTDEQITRALRQQIGGITDVEISTALSTAPCERLQPQLPQIQTAPAPDEPPELPFPDEEFTDEPEPDYVEELLPSSAAAQPVGWWRKWWWAAALGVVAVGVGGYVVLRKQR